MADAPTFISVVANVVPVLVGGLLAAGAGGGTQWLLHNAKIDEEKRTRRAAKFEELVEAIYDYEHWLTMKRDVVVFGQEHQLAPSPFARVQAITAVYFPTFMDDVKKLDDAADKYELWILDRGQSRLRGESDLLKGSKEAYEDYSWRRLKLLSDLRDLARGGLN